jgi:hypothetical protein
MPLTTITVITVANKPVLLNTPSSFIFGYEFNSGIKTFYRLSQFRAMKTTRKPFLSRTFSQGIFSAMHCLVRLSQEVRRHCAV